MTDFKPSESSKPWNLPPLGNTDSPSAAAFVQSTFNASSNDRSQQTAAEEAFQKGYQEGLLAAEAESSQQEQELTQTLEFLRNPVKKIDSQIEQFLVEISLEVAKQILRREIKTDPQHIVGLVRSAVEQLPSGQHEINIHLNPDDAVIVEKTLSKYDSEREWNIIRDPAIHQGECNIHAEPSFINASAAAIINRLAVTILGGDRESDKQLAEQ